MGFCVSTFICFNLLCANALYKEFVQAFGFKYNPQGMLFDTELRQLVDFVSTLRVDWVHNELQHGTFAVECGLWIEACGRVGLGHNCWADLMRSAWQFPRHHEIRLSNLKEIFGKYGAEYAEKNRKLKCKAADYIAVYSLIRHYVETSMGDIPELRLQRASFEGACECVDLVLEAKRAPADNLDAVCDDLERAQRDHFALHKQAYGTGSVIPKHHARLHEPQQFRLDRGVLDMWVVERMNLRVKRVGEAVCNTRCYEASVLASLVTKQKNELQDAPSLLPSLLGCPTPAFGQPGVETSAGARGFGVCVAKGDIVFHLGLAGVIQCCASDRGGLFAICNLLVRDGPSWHSAATYKLTLERRVWRLEQVREAIAWYSAGAHHYVVLR